ncbi:MAG: hypothetical protein ACR2I5_06550, partial [Candidatus Limnocylindria bacterium]
MSRSAALLGGLALLVAACNGGGASPSGDSSAPASAGGDSSAPASAGAGGTDLSGAEFTVGS